MCAERNLDRSFKFYVDIVLGLVYMFTVAGLATTIISFLSRDFSQGNIKFQLIDVAAREALKENKLEVVRESFNSRSKLG